MPRELDTSNSLPAEGYDADPAFTPSLDAVMHGEMPAEVIL